MNLKAPHFSSLFQRIVGISIVNAKAEFNRIETFQCYSIHHFLPGILPILNRKMADLS